MRKNGLSKPVAFGLPEVDDRYDVWRVPLLSKISKHKIGEVVIDAKTTLIEEGKTTQPPVLQERILNGDRSKKKSGRSEPSEGYQLSQQRNTIALGDAEDVLQQMAAKSVDLIFT